MLFFISGVILKMDSTAHWVKWDKGLKISQEVRMDPVQVLPADMAAINKKVT